MPQSAFPQAGDLVLAAMRGAVGALARQAGRYYREFARGQAMSQQMKTDPFLEDMGERAEYLDKLFENADRANAERVAKLPKCAIHPDQPLYPAGFHCDEGGCDTCGRIKENAKRERSATRWRQRNINKRRN